MDANKLTHLAIPLFHNNKIASCNKTVIKINTSFNNKDKHMVNHQSGICH